MKTQKQITVLGAGLVGGTIAIDLCREHRVTSVDISSEALERLQHHNIHTIAADLSDPGQIRNVIAKADLVISAVPGFLGYETLKTVIEAGKNVVDIAFFPEDPFELDELARRKGVTAVFDAGVAPGMGNIILGYHNAKMKVSDYECLVGGLPEVREWPFEYKAVFSPIDVIEEYVRPARFISNGQLVEREALSDAEHVYFDGIGTLESWNSDGLRSLSRTMDIPNMIEKTLRYPGTIEYLKVLRECGYFSSEEIEVNGQMVRPIDVTARLLFPKWQLKPGEADFTVMRIVIKGEESGSKKTYTYHLHDVYDYETQTHSMARTTGFTCTAIASLMLSGQFVRKGICPPEYVGVDATHFEFVLEYLKARGVTYQVSEMPSTGDQLTG